MPRLPSICLCRCVSVLGTPISMFVAQPQITQPQLMWPLRSPERDQCILVGTLKRCDAFQVLWAANSASGC